MSADVLVLDASARQALVAIRELGRAGLAVGAADPSPRALGFASRWCARHRVLPDFAEDPGAFADAVLALCREWSVRAVIPCHDGAIAALRARRADFEGVAGLGLAPEAPLSIAVDKHRTLNLAEQLGLRVPRGAMVSSVAEGRDALEALSLPVVVKPAQSWMGAGASRRRQGATLATTREQALALIADMARGGTEAAVQAWLPGAREALSFVYADGRFLARFAQRADRMLPAIGGSSIVREAIALPPDTTATAEELVAAIGLEGYCEVEFRRDAQGRPVLMEINPRLSASVEIAVRAGVPFPRLVYELAAGAAPEPAGAGYRVGTRMRWLGGDALWLAQALRGDRGNPDLPPRGRALGMFLGAFLRPSGYDLVQRGDLQPAVVAAGTAARHVPARVRGAVRGLSRGG